MLHEKLSTSKEDDALAVTYYAGNSVPCGDYSNTSCFEKNPFAETRSHLAYRIVISLTYGILNGDERLKSRFFA